MTANRSGSDGRKASANLRAIALKYDSERGTAPLITAVGKGNVAERIIEVAADSGVVRVEDELQANALSAFDAGARVPKFLYDLVAEVLLFIEEADEKNRNMERDTAAAERKPPRESGFRVK
jgi:flagellar biosynthesis protein